MKKLAFLASFTALAVVGPASAELIHFDRIPNPLQLDEGHIPKGWGSFDWSSKFWWTNSVTDPDTGYQYGIVSPPNAAFNADGANVSFRRNTPFELVSFYLTAAWRNGLEVTVNGFSDGALVDSTTFTVNASGPTLETLNWDVNRVTFHSFGGTSAGYDGGIDGNQFVLDNLTTMPISAPSATPNPFSNAIPEASTWAMMLLGFAGLSLVGFSSSKCGQT
jgi:hypothetical protein